MGIMKNIINKNKAPRFQSAFKRYDGSIISSSALKLFFHKFGPTLTRKMPNVGKLPKDFLAQMAEKSLFLDPVTVGEINN